MKQYIKTSWYRWTFKEDQSSDSSDSNNNWEDGIWRRNYWTVNSDSLRDALNGLSEYCNENNYEIKAVMPIDRAQSYTYGQNYSNSRYNTTTQAGWGYGWGLGQGWGISMTDGFVAMLQSIEMLSDEEFDKRITEDKRIAKEEKEKKKKVDALTEEKNRLTKKIKQIQDAMPDSSELRAFIASGVVEKTKGLLKKKVVYLVADKEFPSRDEALEQLKDLEIMVDKGDARIVIGQEKIAAYEEELSRCVKELESMK